LAVAAHADIQECQNQHPQMPLVQNCQELLQMQKKTWRQRMYRNLCRKVSAHHSDQHMTLLISFMNWSGYQSLALITMFLCGVEAQIIVYTLQDDNKNYTYSHSPPNGGDFVFWLPTLHFSIK